MYVSVYLELRTVFSSYINVSLAAECFWLRVRGAEKGFLGKMSGRARGRFVRPNMW